MKSYTLILTIILSVILQVSLFFGQPEVLIINLILIIAWLIFMNESRTEFAIYVLVAGVLADLLRLEGVGMLSFSIFIGAMLYLFIESLIDIKRNIGNFILLLFVFALSSLSFAFVNQLFSGGTFNVELYQSILFGAVINWVIFSILNIIYSTVKPKTEALSFLNTRKKK